MHNIKEIFLKKDLVAMLKKLKADEKGKWGIMNAQQMVEHFIDAVQNANGKLVLPVLNEGERLQKSREFLLSEKLPLWIQKSEKHNGCEYSDRLRVRSITELIPAVLNK